MGNIIYPCYQVLLLAYLNFHNVRRLNYSLVMLVPVLCKLKKKQIKVDNVLNVNSFTSTSSIVECLTYIYIF